MVATKCCTDIVFLFCYIQCKLGPFTLWANRSAVMQTWAPLLGSSSSHQQCRSPFLVFRLITTVADNIMYLLSTVFHRVETLRQLQSLTCAPGQYTLVRVISSSISAKIWFRNPFIKVIFTILLRSFPQILPPLISSWYCRWIHQSIHQTMPLCSIWYMQQIALSERLLQSQLYHICITLFLLLHLEI